MRNVLILLCLVVLAGCGTTSLSMKMTKGDNTCETKVKGWGLDFLLARSAAKDCIKAVDQPVQPTPKVEEDD